MIKRPGMNAETPTKPALTLVAAAPPVTEPDVPVAEELAPLPEPALPAQLTGTVLKPVALAEADDPNKDVKVGPWAVRRTSDGVVIDRNITDSSVRASHGVFFRLEDKGFGDLLVLVAPQPRDPNSEIGETKPTLDEVAAETGIDDGKESE